MHAAFSRDKYGLRQYVMRGSRILLFKSLKEAEELTGCQHLELDTKAHKGEIREWKSGSKRLQRICRQGRRKKQ